MKRILIPAFFVVDIPDDVHSDKAEKIAADMMLRANDIPNSNATLLFDEELPNKQVQIPPEASELPHTYNMTLAIVT